jgi:hypothetical protein
MVVAMHEDLRLRQIVGQDALKGLVEHVLLFGIKLDVQVAIQVPIREQAHFAQQQFGIVRRQFARLTGELNLDQAAVGVEIKTVGTT